MKSLLTWSVGMVGHIDNESTDHIKGTAPVPFWVRPEPRRPGRDFVRLLLTANTSICIWYMWNNMGKSHLYHIGKVFHATGGYGGRHGELNHEGETTRRGPSRQRAVSFGSQTYLHALWESSHARIDAGIDLIHVRYEAAAVRMPDAWGRLTGEPEVALVTADPRQANALSALYVATMAESPMILVSGHGAGRSLLRAGEGSQADLHTPRGIQQPLRYGGFGL